MVTLYTDSRMLDHRPHASHPERPERLAAVLRHLQRTGQHDRLPRPELRPATDDELLRVHTPRHLEAIRQAVADRPGQIEADTWVSAGSELAARLAAGAAIDAVTAVATGRSRRAFCAVRPPGHHARPDDPMGFCLYGTVAAAAAHARASLGVNRVLIVDWDVHHGNGTQEMFYDDPAVAFFSMHRYPFYPGSGSATETGTGRGLGATRNVPLAFGTARAEVLRAFGDALGDFADAVRPELIILSAGFDAHAEDPVGNLGLETEEFAAMARVVLQVAATHAGGRLVSVLEGGYNVPILAGCVAEHLDILENKPQ